MTTSRRIYGFCRRILSAVVDPLRVDDTPEQFTLCIPEAQTTTVDSVQGWGKRPPAALECPDCGGRMHQRAPIDDIDCTECWRTFDNEAFPDLALLTMVCPRCGTDMEHGTRHPNVFDVPEYATCMACQYHWDLDHWY